MIMKNLLAISMLLILVSGSFANEEIKLEQKVTGKISDDALKAICPPDGLITSTVSWRKLWAAWRPQQPLPDVDFQKHLVLVETVSGPNNMFVNQLNLKNNGDLKYDVASTRIAGPGFAYLILIVPKAGIRTVNGKPVPLTAATQPSVKPDASATAESVKVDITGRVKTGVVTIGAETTGAMIAADGIVWELDLQNDEQLVEAARHLGASLARVKGQLKRKAGTEVRDRWIVKVDSLKPVQSKPGETPKTETQTSPQVTFSRPAETTRPQVTISRPSSTNPPMEENQPPALVNKSFKSITVETTGGLIGVNQSQTVDADGKAIFEIDNQIADRWNLDAATLSRLHQFVAQTDWRQVPRLTRTPNVADVFNYTISIKTPKGITRIFIDSPAVTKQPVIKQLLTYLRKPKIQPRR